MARPPSDGGSRVIVVVAPQATAVGTCDVELGRARVRFSSRFLGDMADATGVDDAVEARRWAVVPRPWTWLRQVHGSHVVTATSAGDGAGAEADGAVSAAPGAALAVLTADCGPVALASPEGIIGVAHAGWRGLLAGIIPRTVDAMRGLGASEVVAAVGPCIHPECYPFGVDVLDQMVAAFGETVRSTSRQGGPSVDLPAAIRASLGQADARLLVDVGICTSCSPDYWSWREGKPRQRQATVVWLP